MSDPRAKRLKPDTEANAVEEALDIPGEGGRLANGGQEPPSEDVDKAGEDQAIARLKDVQAELEQVSDEASIKVLEVEMEYNQRRKPVYEKRNQLISQIKTFWLSVFLQHPHLNESLCAGDVEALSHLDEVDIADAADIKSGFTITFRFGEGNRLFANQELRKEYFFTEDGRLTINGTHVEWIQDPPEDEELTASGRKRPRPRESFFNWFDPPGQGVPQNVDVDSTAEALKDDIWPNPLKFFSGDILLPEELEEGMPGNPIDLDDEEEGEDFAQDDLDQEEDVDGLEYADEDEYDEGAEGAGEEVEGEDLDEGGEEKYDEGGAAAGEEFEALGEADDLGEGGAGAYEGDDLADDEEQEASALVQDEGAEALEEGDLEEAFVGAAGTAAEGLVVGPDRGGGAAPDPGGDDEEYYDDEGADNDREDDEE